MKIILIKIKHRTKTGMKLEIDIVNEVSSAAFTKYTDCDIVASEKDNGIEFDFYHINMEKVRNSFEANGIVHFARFYLGIYKTNVVEFESPRKFKL